MKNLDKMLSIDIQRVLQDDININKFQNENQKIMNNMQKRNTESLIKRHSHTLPSSFRFLQRSIDQSSSSPKNTGAGRTVKGSFNNSIDRTKEKEISSVYRHIEQ